MRLLALKARWAISLFALFAAGCADDKVTECRAPAGGTATCAQACENLFDRECRVGEDVDECTAICEGSTTVLAPEVRDRVLSCYADVGSCAEIDGCSRACGDGDGPVGFGQNLDGGSPVGQDAGADSGVDAGIDAGQ